MKEQLEILRRIAERGVKAALEKQDSQMVDVFNHLLSEIQVTKRMYEGAE